MLTFVGVPTTGGVFVFGVAPNCDCGVERDTSEVLVGAPDVEFGLDVSTGCEFTVGLAWDVCFNCL